MYMYQELNEVEHFIGIDIETTGLNPNRDLILEIGIVPMDKNLNILSKFSWVIKHDVDFVKTKMSNFVIDMHTKNGLLDEIPNGVSFATVEREIADIVSSFGGNNCLAFGSNVWFDKSFIAAQMPYLASKFSYRMVDVSGMALLLHKTDGFNYEKVSSHRVLNDIENSVKLAKECLCFLSRDK